jgi:cupin 2 domain-containing protein
MNALTQQSLANIFAQAAPPTTGERFETLVNCRGVVIERIVSSAVIAPNEYLQAQDEWVLLVQGEATLEVEGQELNLSAGDHLFLAAMTRHSVVSVSKGALWLVVHIHPTANPETKP